MVAVASSCNLDLAWGMLALCCIFSTYTLDHIFLELGEDLLLIHNLLHS